MVEGWKVPAKWAGRSVENIEKELECPIGLVLLENPYQCPHCQVNASFKAFKQHIINSNSCFQCGQPLSIIGEIDDLERILQIMPNRKLADVIHEVAPLLDRLRTPEGGMVHHSGMLYEYSEPFKVLFVGAMGTGKSSLISMLHKLATGSDSEDDVTAEGDGARGTTKEFKCAVENLAMKAHGREVRLTMFDSPGFNDPEIPHRDLMRALNAATEQMSLGMDAIVHVIRKGRLCALDRQLPEILIAALADTQEQKTELLRRWIMVVTHADSQKKRVKLENIQEFRGQMKGIFPTFMVDIIDKSIFLEMGRGHGQQYSDLEKHKDTLLMRITECRQVFQHAFVSVRLDDLIRNSMGHVMYQYKGLRLELKDMKKEEATSLYNFFQVVEAKKCFLEITASVLPDESEFRKAWNALNMACRDSIATAVAAQVRNEVKVETLGMWSSFFAASECASREQKPCTDF